MKKFSQNFKRAVKFPFSFLLVMLLFLGVCLGTSGSVNSTGKSFELQNTTDTNWSWIVFEISAPKTADKDGKEKDVSVRLHDVYLNLGQIYSREETATIELQKGYSSTKAEDFYKPSALKTVVLSNPAYVAPEDLEEKAEEKDYLYDWAYNWIAPFGIPALSNSDKSVSSASPLYFKLVLPKVNSKYKNSNVLVNEIVFVGEVYEENKGTGKFVPLPVKIDEKRTYVPDEGDKKENAKRAEALIDAQRVPTLSQSSFFQYGNEEKKILMTLSEAGMGNSYVPGDTYEGDRTYNSLGLNLAYLGTLIFGTSPFGLRFFNTLASFGILVVGFFFVTRLFKSDKAGLSFAVIYALCGASISLAHLASPIMIGVFFLLASLAGCYRFFEEGMKKPSPTSTLPLLLSGICGALAVLVNGAFVVPLAGVTALFVAGVVKQHFKNRAALSEAIAFAEAEKTQGVPAILEDGSESEGNKKVRTSLSAYRYETAASSIVFACSLILGIFVFSILSALPLFYAADKIYNGVVGTSSNLFKVVYRMFAAGFTGDALGWNYFYPIFTGTGESYAATFGVMNFAASLLGLLGIAFAIYRIVTLAKRKAKFSEYYSVIIPLAGMILSLVTAAFAGGAVAFVLLANLFAFALVSGGAEVLASEGEKRAKAVFIIKIVALALLVCCFALLAVFTFSIPLSAGLMQKLI